jgi:ribosomal protein L11 methylase PrmA
MTDLDPLCDAEVKKTFALNDVPLERARLICGPKADLKREGTSWPKADLLLSNIYAEVLASLIHELGALVNPGAPWVVSGLLEGPATEAFEAAATDKLFKLEERRSQSRERPLWETGKNAGLRLETETWGGRVFRRS